MGAWLWTWARQTVEWRERESVCVFVGVGVGVGVGVYRAERERESDYALETTAGVGNYGRGYVDVSRWRIGGRTLLSQSVTRAGVPVERVGSAVSCPHCQQISMRRRFLCRRINEDGGKGKGGEGEGKLQHIHPPISLRTPRKPANCRVVVIGIHSAIGSEISLYPPEASFHILWGVGLLLR